MADDKGFNYTKALQVVVPLVSVSIAVISLLVSLARGKKELAWSYLGSEEVVRLKPGDIDLSIRFQEQEIKSITKMNFAVTNTGDMEIEDNDVKMPLAIHFSEDVKLLSSFVERTVPEDLEFRTVMLPGENPQKNAVGLKFLLLNSGDQAYFSVYVYDSQASLPQLRGRIVGIRKIRFLDESTAKSLNPFPYLDSRGGRQILYWVLFGFNSGSSLFFLGFLTWVSFGSLRYLVWTRRWKVDFDKVVHDVIAMPVKEQRELSGTKLQIPNSVYRVAGYKISGTPIIAVLEKNGIPVPPESKFYNLKDYLMMALVVSALLALLAATAVFMYFSPRGY